MKTRVISGTCFVILMAGFFLLREFVSPLCFTGLIFFFSICGGIETSRAISQKTGAVASYACLILSIISVPVYMWLSVLFESSMAYLVFITISLLVFIFVVIYTYLSGAEENSAIVGGLCSLYPSVFMLSFVYLNDVEGRLGFIALLLVFVIASLTDTFAYFVGSTLKGKKLCPKLSPKKTWSGAIGGLFGGILGAILIYFIFNDSLTQFSWWHFVIIGFIGAVLDQVGDLFESFIKRHVGIKDMGKIMPGHGGVMDRLDGAMFVALAINLALLII